MSIVNINGKASSLKWPYQRVHCLVSCLACLETIVDCVSPWTHLHRADEVGINDRLLVQAWQKRGEVLPDEMRLGTSGRVQC
jgi:hypothetical protein